METGAAGSPEQLLGRRGLPLLPGVSPAVADPRAGRPVSRGGWRALPLAWPPVQLLSLLTTRAFLSPSGLLLSCSFLLPFLPPTRLPHPAPAPQIKRFLEDADDAELNKFVTDFPGSETYHPPEAKTLVPRPQIQEPRPQASDLCQDDLEFKPPSWPQPSDSQQYFSASAPLSPSARPRSPWGKLDPYDSSEVEPPAPVCAVG